MGYTRITPVSNVSIAARNNNSNKISTQLSGLDFGGKAKPRKLQKGLLYYMYGTVAHKCQGKTFFLKAKLSFSRQNFLSQGKTFSLKAKLSFSRQSFLIQDKTFFPKTKLTFSSQNFLPQDKTFFPRQNFLSQGKTFFLKAKLSFSRQKLLSRLLLKGPKVPKVIIILSGSAICEWHEYHRRS